MSFQEGGESVEKSNERAAETVAGSQPHSGGVTLRDRSARHTHGTPARAFLDESEALPRPL